MDCGALVGQDDGVEAVAEFAGLDVGVVQLGVVEAVVVEDEARPAFIHRGIVGLVDGDARRRSAWWRAGASQAGAAEATTSKPSMALVQTSGLAAAMA